MEPTTKHQEERRKFGPKKGAVTFQNDLVHCAVGGSVWQRTLPGCGGICRRYLAYGVFIFLDLLLSFPSKGHIICPLGLFYAVCAEYLKNPSAQSALLYALQASWGTCCCSSCIALISYPPVPLMGGWHPDAHPQDLLCCCCPRLRYTTLGYNSVMRAVWLGWRKLVCPQSCPGLTTPVAHLGVTCVLMQYFMGKAGISWVKS